MNSRKGINYAKYGYFFSIPFLLAFLIFHFYPTIYTAILGFTDLQGLGKTDWNILEEPLDNFKRIINNPSFITSLRNTAHIWILNFIPQIGLALLLTAWFTSRGSRLRGQGFFKVVFYMPNIITAATIAILFNALFQYPMSPANDLIMKLGIVDELYNF